MPSLVFVAISFEGTYEASRVLGELRTTQPSYAWFEEVAIIERHHSGRVSSRGTYAGYYFEDEEGSDTLTGAGVGTLTGSLIGIIGGPAGVAIGAAAGALVGGSVGAIGDVEKRDQVYRELKEVLPKGSSALALLAAGPTIDEMVSAFAPFGGAVYRRDVSADEVERLKKQAAKG